MGLPLASRGETPHTAQDSPTTELPRPKRRQC